MRHAIENVEHWHLLRHSCVGASEVAALFGCGYQSHFQLWHEKKGDLAHADYTDNERVVLGKCLEEGIARAAAELYDYPLIKASAYYTDDSTPGLGATPDYFLVREGGEFPAEVKNASWGSFKDNWVIHEDGFTEAPLRFQLQVQTQLACTGAAAGLLVALISGDRIVRCEIPRHEKAIAEIRAARGRASGEPSRRTRSRRPRCRPTWTRRNGSGTSGDGNVDLRGDTDVEGWLDQLRELRDMRKRVEGDESVIEGMVLAYCVSNQYAAITRQRRTRLLQNDAREGGAARASSRRSQSAYNFG